MSTFGVEQFPGRISNNFFPQEHLSQLDECFNLKKDVSQNRTNLQKLQNTTNDHVSAKNK